ncbi:hypothetical protein EYF80_007292 [Liparis tanakae]|uniref:Uncharacterized protein n=1 Tax=Liparis tanakae TaxID=230148 RepID=A0A4Z2IXG4_9TELE|nr:hypothetical protein EYF80_007292 [Liparis tanakae]
MVTSCSSMFVSLQCARRKRRKSTEPQALAVMMNSSKDNVIHSSGRLKTGGVVVGSPSGDPSNGPPFDTCCSSANTWSDAKVGSPDLVTSILGIHPEGKMLFLCALLQGMKLLMLSLRSWQQVRDTELAATDT